jgi:MscS family membrane protein
MSVFRLLVVLVLITIDAHTVFAQPAAEPENEGKLAEVDPFNRETPRGAVTGLIDALAAQDYARAANFFDMPVEESSTAADRAADLARRLQSELDRGGSLLSFAVLSNDPTGRADDGLPIAREQVGTFGGAGNAPIFLSRSEGPAGSPIWRISQETIGELTSRASLIMPRVETEEARAPLISGAPLYDWALLLGIAAGSFLVFWLISAAVLAAMRAIIADHASSPVYRFTHAALLPLSLFLAVVGFQLWAHDVEASIVARQTLLRYIGVVAWFALAWFALRMIDAIAQIATSRMARHDRRQAVSLITLLRRTTKVIVLAIATVSILDTFGVDVTTGVAALGIGGIALALGAQKTIENLVGSVTVIADIPVQVGDFCRVGDVAGTVEDIGIRSTRIRTTERTVVTIPNGDFASRQIENFAKRDRFLFNPTIGLEYGISSARLRAGAEMIEQILLEHELVDKGARARFANFGASSLDIEVFSYIKVSDFGESLKVRQELLLTIFERLEAAGLAIAFPTRTVHLIQEDGQKDRP